ERSTPSWQFLHLIISGCICYEDICLRFAYHLYAVLLFYHWNYLLYIRIVGLENLDWCFLPLAEG
ncbi:hypothetical protein L9F63_023147, partial [Diploptera punctata]